jgi:hypothetical protein
MYAQAATANARASKRLTAELKTLETQKHRQMVKLHNSKFQIKSALSMPCLYGSQDTSGHLSVPVSPRPPSSSLPVSPITGHRAPRRRHSEAIPSTRARQFKGRALGNQPKVTNRLNSANCEGNLKDAPDIDSCYTA